jgi:hypothetical protein
VSHSKVVKEQLPCSSHYAAVIKAITALGSMSTYIVNKVKLFSIGRQFTFLFAQDTLPPTGSIAPPRGQDCCRIRHPESVPCACKWT